MAVTDTFTPGEGQSDSVGWVSTQKSRLNNAGTATVPGRVLNSKGIAADTTGNAYDKGIGAAATAV